MVHNMANILGYKIARKICAGFSLNLLCIFPRLGQNGARQTHSCEKCFQLPVAGSTSKCASVGAWLLINKISCGQQDITTMQSRTARNTT